MPGMTSGVKKIWVGGFHRPLFFIIIRNMKNFFKQIFTLESPLGEAWIIAIAVVVLGGLGLMSLNSVAGWLLIAFFFAVTVAIIAAIQIWWQRRK